MARTATINYRRVTISLPQKVAEELRGKTEKNKMSNYIADLIMEDFARREKEEENINEFYKSLEDFSKKITKKFTDKRSSVEILREIRYGADA